MPVAGGAFWVALSLATLAFGWLELTTTGLVWTWLQIAPVAVSRGWRRGALRTRDARDLSAAGRTPATPPGGRRAGPRPSR
ncbi:hypothetical protein [Streptomyces thioluteus]|uniref:hypothetical protein n=1 Tax=Streptomyces thioluteus TaxID=66431 RepID=UPI0031E69C9B